jgi:hypothetical protein
MLLLALILTVVFSARSRNEPPPASTLDVGRVQTEAVATFAGGLTSTAETLPTDTLTETPEPPTAEGAATSSTASTSSVSSTPSCYRSKFIRDVTIPDYTVMTPAEVFTKAWQVQNSGTCPWRPGFKLVLVGGVAMGGSPFVIDATVNSGAQIEISVKMVAPTNQTGLIQGTWQLTDDTGTPFGNVFTVVIVVGNGTTAPPTMGTTATP